MARRFAYISFGILCLTAAYQLGAERASADWDQTLSGQVVGIDGAIRVWDNAGRGWTVEVSPPEWVRVASLDLPVPVSEVKILAGNAFITYDDVAWVQSGGQWVNCGPFPGGPIAVEQESAGSVKGKYRQ